MNSTGLGTSQPEWGDCAHCGKRTMLSNEDYDRPEGQFPRSGVHARFCPRCVANARLRLALQLQQTHRPLEESA